MNFHFFGKKVSFVTKKELQEFYFDGIVTLVRKLNRFVR